jgi:hypothetical protein
MSDDPPATFPGPSGGNPGSDGGTTVTVPDEETPQGAPVVPLGTPDVPLGLPEVPAAEALFEEEDGAAPLGVPKTGGEEANKSSLAALVAAVSGFLTLCAALKKKKEEDRA